MTILIVSDEGISPELADIVARSKTSRIELITKSGLKNLQKRELSRCCIYINARHTDLSVLKSIGRSADRLGCAAWGVFDPDDSVSDPAELFFAGASDYLGSMLWPGALNTARIKRVLAFRGYEFPDEGSGPEKGGEEARNGPEWSGWAALEEDREYVFTLVYLQIDHLSELIERIGDRQLRRLVEELKRQGAAIAAERQGIVWMWNDSGGLLLLPFNGRDCPFILDLVRFYLDLPILQAERAALNLPFTFRTVIHIDSTLYRAPGRTGGVVSDAVNSIFHLGMKHAVPGTLSLTPEAARFIPRELHDLFVPGGTFEGRALTRLKRLG